MTALPPEARRPRTAVGAGRSLHRRRYLVAASDSLSGRLAATYADWDKPSQARTVHDELVARAAEAYVQPTVLAWSAAAGGLNDDAVKLAEHARPRHRGSSGGAAPRRRHHAGGVDDMKGSHAFGAHSR